MCENEELKNDTKPEVEEDKVPEATIPQETVIPVKFNKKVRNLTIEEASDLAQKGLKFDAISKDYETLRNMAAEGKKSVSMFLEEIKSGIEKDKLENLTAKCGGDTELAKRIMTLEKGNSTIADSGFEEVKEYFPEIESADMLPQQVIKNAELSGRSLLDEYLRYCLKEKRLGEEAVKNQKAAERASGGSMINRAAVQSPETAEFLRGLWN